MKYCCCCLSKPLATHKNASKLCSLKGRQLLNTVKGLVLAASNQQRALTQPKVTMPKHLQRLVGRSYLVTLGERRNIFYCCALSLICKTSQRATRAEIVNVSKCF